MAKEEEVRESQITSDDDDEYLSDVDSENLLGGDWKRFLYGVTLASVSGILFTANNFVINLTQVDVGDAVLVRTAVQIVLYVVILIKRKEDLFPPSGTMKFFTILQGLAGATTFITALACVSFIDVPDALCIIFSCPVVTIFLSAIILKERLNYVKILASVLLLSGVTLVVKPPFLFHSTEHLEADDKFAVGVVLAIISCVSGGLRHVSVAKCEDVSASVLVLWTALLGFVIAVIYGLLHPGSNILSLQVAAISARDWAIFFGMAFSGLIAFATLTMSLKVISPSLVASLRASELVLAFICQSVITGVAPPLLSWLGGGLIIIGVLMLALQFQLLSLPALLVSLLSRLRSRPESEGPTEYTSLLP